MELSQAHLHLCSNYIYVYMYPIELKKYRNKFLKKENNFH